MPSCPQCGRDLPPASAYCPDCGAKVIDLAVPLTGMTPSNFNTTMTTSVQPQSAPPGADYGREMLPLPLDEQRDSARRRKRLMLAGIAVLAVLLVGATIEAGYFSPASTGVGPAINSPSSPLTGAQLYSAYASNQTQAAASYTNKTIYVRDSLDFGVSRDFTGQYFSSINSGTVILFWDSQANVNQLGPGAVILAECSVQGLTPQGGVLLLYLQDCALVKIQSEGASTTTGPSVPPTNV